MDKYEFNLKIDQMKTLCAEENYDAAAEIADGINWTKVKNVNALVKAGEIYEKVGRFEESREILLAAYDRSPIGRMIIYRLAEVAIKMADLTAAEEYYKEFVEIAPHDNLRYVLRYQIQKAEGASFEKQIEILEELKEQEYTEEWAYELALLYHQSKQIEKCVDACDELILWFGDGPYVERALELKMLYQPLSKAQEEKYRRFRLEKQGITSIGAEEMAKAGEYAHEPVEIPQVSLNPERFNTVNLQEEIAKGMQQIMDATEKTTVSDTIDNIKKIVGDNIPYLQLPSEEETADRETPHIETDEEIDGSLRLNFQEMLGEESDGQISLVMSEQAKLEQQITGQMTIEDVLEEWEKTKRAAEAALQDAEARKLESAKARALQEAGDIMNRLNDVIPQLDAGVTPKELLEHEYLQTDQEIPTQIQRSVEEVETLPLETEVPVISVESFGEVMETKEQEMEASSELALEIEPEPKSEEEADTEEEQPQEPDNEIVAEEIPTELSEALQDKTATKRMPSATEIEASPKWKGKSPKMPDMEMPEDLSLEIEEALPEEEQDKIIDHLTSEQKAIFSYFVPVKGMEGQLCQALTGAMRHLEEDHTASTGNIIIQGGRGCGKTVLATSLIKVLQKETGHPNGKVGKIEAAILNEKNIQELLRKVAGGCLIIERAGDLSRESAVTLSLLLENDDSGILVILEDTSKGIKKVLMQDEGFAKKFSEKITVPIFTNDELVSFAKSYAKELGYEIDEMAILALYNRISNIQRLDQATTLSEVKDIVDEAIQRESRGGLKKAISILTASRYTDEDCILLKEKDFE